MLFKKRQIIVRDEIGQEQSIDLKPSDQLGGAVAFAATAVAVVLLAGTVILQTKELNDREQELADVVQAYSELADQIVEAEDRLAGQAEELAARHELLSGIIANLDSDGTALGNLDSLDGLNAAAANTSPEAQDGDRSMGGPSDKAEAPATLQLAPGIPFPSPNPLRTVDVHGKHSFSGAHSHSGVSKSAQPKKTARAVTPGMTYQQMSAAALDLPVSEKWAVAVVSPQTAVFARRDDMKSDPKGIYYKLAATPIWMQESRQRVADKLAQIDQAQSGIALALGGAARREISRIEAVYARLNLPSPLMAEGTATSDGNSGLAMGGPFVGLDEASRATDAVTNDEISAPEIDHEDINLAAQELRKLEALRQSVDQLPLDMPVRQSTFWFSSRYGARQDPFNKRWAHHSGLDFAGRHRTPIYAPAGGIVTYAKSKGAYGKVVEIDHGNGVKTRFGHLNALLVQRGNRVARGQQIALMGSTGRSTGSHLHYEIWVNGKHRDPMTFLKAGAELNGTIVADANGRN